MENPFDQSTEFYNLSAPRHDAWRPPRPITPEMQAIGDKIEKEKDRG